LLARGADDGVLEDDVAAFIDAEGAEAHLAVLLEQIPHQISVDGGARDHDGAREDDRLVRAPGGDRDVDGGRSKGQPDAARALEGRRLVAEEIFHPRPHALVDVLLNLALERHHRLLVGQPLTTAAFFTFHLLADTIHAVPWAKRSGPPL